MIPVPTSVSAPTFASTNSGVNCPLPSAECAFSYNWGGYAVCVPTSNCEACLALLSSCNPNATADVNDVKGSWIVPAIVGATGSRCPDPDKTWYDVSNWIGIDGFVDQTVEQTGTASDCYYGQVYYYAWYEFYPQASYVTFKVHPGDLMWADVSYSTTTQNFTTTIVDLTTNQRYTASSAVPDAKRTSAEWITESAYFDGYLALTHFTRTTFTNATATIGKVTHTIAGWAPKDYWLLMVDYNFGVNEECSPVGCPTPQTETLAYSKSIPSGLSQGSSFDMKWLSSGP